MVQLGANDASLAYNFVELLKNFHIIDVYNLHSALVSKGPCNDIV